MTLGPLKIMALGAKVATEQLVLHRTTPAQLQDLYQSQGIPQIISGDTLTTLLKVQTDDAERPTEEEAREG